jgi:hypothetical protein
MYATSVGVCWNAYNILVGKPKGKRRDQSEGLGVDGRIISE